jgi:hypothetical protein
MVMSTAFFMGCLASPVHAAITFQFHYTDPAGTGFLDPLYGSARQAALNTAASTFSNMFGSHFSTTGTIILNADTTDKRGALAGALGYMTDPGAPGFNLGEVVRTKLQSGIDLNGSTADGVVSINFNAPWALDINSPPTQGKTYDFYSTLDHEFTHILGFNDGEIKESGNPAYGTKEAGSWDAFASYLVDRHDDKIIDPTTFALNQADWNASSTSDLFFDGPNAMAANGGQPVKLDTPPVWASGSSVSHLDPSYGTLMVPAVHTGSEPRNYSLIEIGILKDLGYVSPVPEPETYSMLLAGLAVCGWIARRRQQT